MWMESVSADCGQGICGVGVCRVLGTGLLAIGITCCYRPYSAK